MAAIRIYETVDFGAQSLSHKKHQSQSFVFILICNHQLTARLCILEEFIVPPSFAY